jgi:hypothetical protein
MLRGCSSFDQNLSGWVPTSVADFTNFLYDATLSTTNYDALLIAWEALDLVDGLSFHAGGSKYSAGAATTARAAIIADDSWTISDGGQA